MPGPWPGLVVSNAVVASPALAAETIIAQVAGVSPDTGAKRIDLSGFAAFTVGTSGTAIRLRIRQTSLTGTVVGDTGPVTAGIAAAALVAQDVEGFDTPGDVATMIYVLTLQITAGAATSTVTAVKLRALLF